MIHRMFKAAWAEMRMILHNLLDFKALLYWRTVCLSAHSLLQWELSPCHLPLTGNKPWHPNGVNQRFRNWNQGTSILALDIHEVHSWHRFGRKSKTSDPTELCLQMRHGRCFVVPLFHSSAFPACVKLYNSFLALWSGPVHCSIKKDDTTSRAHENKFRLTGAI